MPMFVLNRNYVLRSLQGRAIGFEKGVPVHVPPELVKEVVAIGAESVDGQIDVLDPEVEETPQPVGTERDELIHAAFERLVKTNNRADFTGNGMPNPKALERILGFSCDKREIDRLWHERGTRALKEAA